MSFVTVSEAAQAMGISARRVQQMCKAGQIPGFIFEFKHAKADSENLDVLADNALEQIEDRKYDAELKAHNITKIRKIGIAFRGKKAAVKSAR